MTAMVVTFTPPAVEPGAARNEHEHIRQERGDGGDTAHIDQVKTAERIMMEANIALRTFSPGE